MKTINKSFPANKELNIKTFLNDSRIDSELYAYLLSLSKGIQRNTIVQKDIIPTYTKLGEILSSEEKPITRQTIAVHFKYLISQGYLKETKDKSGYYILNPDKYYFNIPLNTLQYLLDNTNSFVIKVYIYLGICWNINPQHYEFTIKEICEHLGINYKNYCNRIRNNLDLLLKLKLIDVDTVYRNNLPYLVLSDFTINHETSDKVKNWR